MTTLTFYDLIGEDHELDAFLNPENRNVLIGITNEKDELVYSEESHIFAWDSLVSFAKQVIAADKRIQDHLELLEG